MQNVAGNTERTINLDSVATLRLFVPCGRDCVTLQWPLLPPLTVANPGVGQKYTIPGQVKPLTFLDSSGAITDMTLSGPGRSIRFDMNNRAHLLRAGDRIFRVSLENIRDMSNAKADLLSIEYDFAVSEEDLTDENRAAAITQDEPEPSVPAVAAVRAPAGPRPPELRERMRNALATQAIGTITAKWFEAIGGKPNRIEVSAPTKSVLFDPIGRVVAFCVVTDAGRNVTLRLTPKELPANEPHFVALVWNDSKGARLHVDDQMTNDGLD
jgi:hypothetical protein